MKDFSDRINQLIALADKVMASNSNSSQTGSRVERELFVEFRASSLSFIKNTYDVNHPYYHEFNIRVRDNWTFMIESGRGILKAIKSELDGGWLLTLKDIVSAEVFSNFLDMSDHLLKENYKDPAAVIIGSVLEEHLRQLCSKNTIPIEENKSGRMVPKKADHLNNELSANSVYNKLDQKNVTAWLDLRNKAAHGKFSEYNKEQVELTLRAVTEFISRNSI
jgi:hypothetical protein